LLEFRVLFLSPFPEATPVACSNSSIFSHHMILLGETARAVSPRT
jgi:hypothetical protein